MLVLCHYISPIHLSRDDVTELTALTTTLQVNKMVEYVALADSVLPPPELVKHRAVLRQYY